MCPDFSSKPLGEYESCYFGKVPNDIVMTSFFKDDSEVINIKQMLLQASNWFGAGKQFVNEFPMFSSDDYNYLGRQNVLFNDATKALVDVGARDRYYTWIGRYFPAIFISPLSHVMQNPVFWCFQPCPTKTRP